MWLTQLTTRGALVFCSIGALLTHEAAADEPAVPQPSARATMDRLTAQSFAELHKLILAQPDEYRWDEIPWFTSIWHARKKAAAENKPLLIFRTHGAGFNDPLGNC
jgi:hypothetical protein